MNQTASVITAVEHALLAPSVHNTQPWRWRIRPGAVELHADWDRHLTATDPYRRDLVLSCGAALHHLQVALAASGLAVEVDRMPDPEDIGHLATVAIRPGPCDPADAVLFPRSAAGAPIGAASATPPVPAGALRTLADEARRTGVLLLPVTTSVMRQRLTAALIEAAHRQEFSPGYAGELQLWTRRYTAGRDGVPAASVAEPLTGPTNRSPLRRFPRGQLGQPRQLPGHGSADDAAD